MNLVLGGIVLAAVFGLGLLLRPALQSLLEKIPKLWMRLLVGVGVPLLVVAAVAAGVWLLSLIGTEWGDKELSAQLIAAWTLLAATLLLYATGRKERTASVDLEVTAATPETKIPKDGEVEDEDYARLTDEQKKKVEKQDDKRIASEELVIPATEKKKITAGELVPAEVYDDLDENQKANVAEQRGLYFRSLYVGADGRWSTSKLQALLWTYAILFALVALFAADQLGLDFIVGTKPGGGSEIGDFADLPFPEEYLLFLGGPFAAAVIAKASTTTKVQQGTVVKPPTTGTGGGDEGTGSGLSDGLKEVISNDAGRTDLLDLQYFFFNLLALSVFLGTFVFALDEGLPEIPLFLVALTGTSALTYATKKSIESATPTIDSVVPASVYPSETLTVEGQHLLAPRAIAPRAMIDGREVPASDVIVVRGTAADSLATLSVKVPSDAEGGTGKKLVLTPVGAKAPASADLTIRGAEIASVQPSSLSLVPSTPIQISGKNFGDSQPEAVTLRLGTLELSVEDEGWSDSLICAKLPATISSEQFAAQGATASLQLVIPGRGRANKDVTIAPLKSTVSSVVPSPLVLEPGARVTIVGTGFGDPTGSVTLDSLGSLEVEEWTDTLIVATLPSPLALSDGKYASETAVPLNVSPQQNRPATASELTVRAPQ